MLWLLELLWKATKLQSFFGFRLSWTFSGIMLRNFDCEQRLLSYRRFIQLWLHRSQLSFFGFEGVLDLLFIQLIRARLANILLVK